MAAPYEDEGLVESDDYYAWLGISKEANQDEINYAFRKLSRIYHPDKHAGNREAEQQAERLFTRIKKAHEILSDPHQRAIYDTVGTSGLETEGWQVISRTKSPREILEEYEALQVQREQQLLQRQTNPRGRVTMAINATNMFEHYDPYDDFDDDDTRASGHLFPYVEVSELSISQSVDCPLTTKDSVTIAGNVFSSNGTGTGNMATTYRRVVSPDCWVETDASVGNELGLGCRLFRNLWKNAHGIMSGSCQVTSKGIKPVCSFTLAQQLDQRLQCRMALRLTPRQSSLQTLCAWDNGRHRVSAAVQLGVPNTFVKLNYFLNLSDYELKLRANFKFGTLSWLAEYGCDKKITAFSTLGVAMAIGVPTGVMLEIKLQRGNQTFVVPIQLSEEISQEPVIYGTVVPLVVFAAVRSLLVAPFLKEQKEKDLKRKKDANSRRMQERKREAETAVDLMQATVERIREEETHKGGLLVNKAVYGKLVEESLSVESRECVDVTSALQVLVKDSKILIAEGTKLSELQGFFDPCVGEEKQICVNYTFRTRLHVCTFTEGQRILLPNRNHQCETQNER